jgi:hypothetical protein
MLQNTAAAVRRNPHLVAIGLALQPVRSLAILWIKQPNSTVRRLPAQQPS